MHIDIKHPYVNDVVKGKAKQKRQNDDDSLSLFDKYLILIKYVFTIDTQDTSIYSLSMSGYSKLNK